MSTVRTIDIIPYFIIFKRIFILNFIHNLLADKLHTFRAINLSHTAVKRMIVIGSAARMGFNKSSVTSEH
jgi:hypothetical protein